jgi:hypothetical protein
MCHEREGERPARPGNPRRGMRSETLNAEPGGDRPAAAQSRPSAGIDDVIVVPLVLIVLAARTLLHVVLATLIHILDYAFPILLQLIRFPLFTMRIIGDGAVLGLNGLVGWLPVPGTKQQAWRERLGRGWSWLRRKLSYRAFEEALHHAFERGMGWMFRTCRRLTPGGALLVIAGAVLWLPVSFGIATAMHAVLLAKALVLPAWMQLLHPLATIIAKSKLMVLPVYPAAWPQAKQHPFPQAVFRLYRYVAALDLVQKARYRYRQAKRLSAETGAVLERAAARAGLTGWSTIALARCNDLAAAIRTATRAAAIRTVTTASRLPLIGAIVRNYSAHYESVGPAHPEKFSKRAGGFFARWSIKFSAEYYEAKERAEAAKALKIAAAQASAMGRPGAGG